MRGLRITLALITACGGGAAGNTVEDTTFDSGLNVDLAASVALPNGSYIRDVEVGTGADVVKGQTISVKYQGWLADGERFDATADGGVFTFIYGKEQVLKGWEEGLDGTKRGGTRQLVLPPKLAYGVQAGAPPAVPPNSVVVFSLQVQPVTTGQPPGCEVAGGPAGFGLLVLVFALRGRRA